MLRRSFRGRGRLALLVMRALVPPGRHAFELTTSGTMFLDTKNPHEVWMYFDLFATDLSILMRRALRPGDTFVDCGANVGYFTFYGAGLVGSGGRVLSVDANPYCAGRVRESRDLGGHRNVELIEAAIGEMEGTVRFHLSDDPMYSSVANLDSDEVEWTATAQTIEVPTRSLDSLLANVPRVRLLKLDVEGAEIDAVKGARRVLSEGRIDFLFTEIHPHQVMAMGRSLDEFHAQLEAHGYQLIASVEDWSCVHASPAALADAPLCRSLAKAIAVAPGERR